MIKRVLVANRGEIAVRVVRACRDLGLSSVVAYSEADAHTEAVRLADDAVCVGPPPAARSYLHVPNIIGAALKTESDAVHPGYGFLSEDPYFAEICADHGLTFIGPPPKLMEQLGSKVQARTLMREHGVSLLPGTLDPLSTPAAAAEAADDIGYPVILKAAAGGGGRGMTVVTDPSRIEEEFNNTRAQARVAFNDGSVYLERYLQGARHVEVQVLCDRHGGGVHLGERDCSVQRRNQKLIEESPCPVMTPELRARMGESAMRGALGIGYEGAGTMEFLLAPDGEYHFLEINARLQVEHPVTEAVTGIDLVREQLRVAAGEPLGYDQGDVRMTGHALECRINAEDPSRAFAPATGRLEEFVPPGGPWVRVDTHCRQGTVVPPFYDSLLAKVITWGADRPETLARMARALREFSIEGKGVATTVGLHQRILADPTFARGEADTSYLSTLTL